MSCVRSSTNRFGLTPARGVKKSILGRMSEREELQAHVAARRELGPEYEPELVDSFLERIEERGGQRGHGKATRRNGRPHRAVTPLVLGSLALSIPLIAVAGAQA